MKFLIDECLSLKLCKMARDAGYEAMHVTHLGMKGFKDSVIAKKALDEDWTIVTCNSDDYRPRPGSMSKKPCYAGVDLHAGLICLNMPESPKKLSVGEGSLIHQKYFGSALRYLPKRPENLDNRIVEVDPHPAYPDPLTGDRVVRIYDFPE